MANPVLDRAARLDALLLGMPLPLVSLVGGPRRHFPGMTGLQGAAAEALAFAGTPDENGSRRGVC